MKHMTHKEKINYWKTRTPLKINGEKIKRLVEAVESGVTRKWAARYAGISPITLYKWIKKGEEIIEKIENDEIQNLHENDEFYLDLINRISKAETEIQKEAFGRMRAAAEEKENWRAAESILKMRFSNDYSQDKKMHAEAVINNSNDPPYTISLFIGESDNLDNKE